MEQRSKKVIHRRRRFLPGFLVTLLWMLPMMCLMAGIGFFFARDVVSPKILRPSDTPYDKPHPIRILSPEEVHGGSKDQASHVWTQGVQPSDIPPSEATPPDATANPHHHWHHTAKKSTPADAAPSADTPATDTGDTPSDVVPTSPGSTGSDTGTDNGTSTPNATPPAQNTPTTTN